MSVPVVDVGCLVRELGDPGSPVGAGALSEEARATVSAVHEFCRGGSGGLILVNHGFEAELDAAMAAAGAFRAASAEVKMAHAGAQLYDPPNTVRVAVRPASLHERMSYPRVVFPEDSIGGIAAADIATAERNDGTDRSPPAPIDEGDADLFSVAGVDRSMRAYQRRLMRLTLALLRATAISLGLPPSHLDAGWAGSNSAINAVFYLPIPSREGAPTSDGHFGQKEVANRPDAAEAVGDLGARMRVYPHADDGAWFTLLVHDRVEGLQVLEERGSDNWIDVERVSDHQIVLRSPADRAPALPRKPRRLHAHARTSHSSGGRTSTGASP